MLNNIPPPNGANINNATNIPPIGPIQSNLIKDQIGSAIKTNELSLSKVVNTTKPPHSNITTNTKTTDNTTETEDIDISNNTESS